MKSIFLCLIASISIAQSATYDLAANLRSVKMHVEEYSKIEDAEIQVAAVRSLRTEIQLILKVLESDKESLKIFPPYWPAMEKTRIPLTRRREPYVSRLEGCIGCLTDMDSTDMNIFSKDKTFFKEKLLQCLDDALQQLALSKPSPAPETGK